MISVLSSVNPVVVAFGGNMGDTRQTILNVDFDRYYK